LAAATAALALSERGVRGVHSAVTLKSARITVAAIKVALWWRRRMGRKNRELRAK
jgi:hypothetical protein